MEFFVFPLPQVVFYPSMVKPLNIFEPRYIKMVRDSIETKTSIALAFVDEPLFENPVMVGKPLPFVREVAGFGEATIVEERPDGSMLVLMQGRGKVKLSTLSHLKEPYLVCKGEVIVENNETSAECEELLKNLHQVYEKWVNLHVADPTQKEQFLTTFQKPNEIIGCFTSYLISDFDMQQMILEQNSIDEKIRLIHGLVQSGSLIR